MPYLANDVNKVFAKVSKKISRVKIERFVTNWSWTPLKNHHSSYLAVTMTALDSQNFTTVTP